MAPKKANKGKGKGGKATVSAIVAQPPDVKCNDAYHQGVRDDVKIIEEKWPTIREIPTLPAAGDNGFKGMIGHGTPFVAAHYDERVKGTGHMTYNTHINVFNHDIYANALPFVPLLPARKIEYATTVMTTPAQVLSGNPLTLVASTPNAASIKWGSVLRVSPCEPLHAVFHRVATRIKENAPESELDEWLKLMLSYPTCFKRLTTQPLTDIGAHMDANYAEANSLRSDILAAGRAVGFTARQLVKNVVGFKAMKEAVTRTTFSAKAVADFWANNIRTTEELKTMFKPSSIDICITIDARLFSIEGVEDMIAGDEAKNGPASFWNSLYRMQELISRLGKKEKILWNALAIQDALDSGVKEITDFPVSALKTGTNKSMTDVYVTTQSMKQYLLGRWLDDKEIPAYIKEKARQIFASHKSCRALWHPLLEDDLQHIDTTWVFGWPPAGKALLDFIESACYLPTPTEEASFRMAVRNSSTIEEVLASPPWKERIADLLDSFRLTAVTAVVGGSSVSDKKDDDHETGACATGSSTPIVSDADKLFQSSQALSHATKKLVVQQCAFPLEQPSLIAMKQTYESTPLALVKATNDSGNVLIVVDCNNFGETDVSPDKRVTPVGKDKIDYAIRPIIHARQGTETPEYLQAGDIYLCIDGGRDRRRQFMKPFKLIGHDKNRKNRNRTINRTTTMHISESSWRLRRKRHRGQAKLTQQIHMVANSATLANIKHCNFEYITGSTRSNVMGPVSLTPLADVPTLAASKKKDFYGKHYILAGGKDDFDDDCNEDDDVNDDDDEDVDEPIEVQKGSETETKPKDPPLNHHALPVEVLLNIIKAYNVKHVIEVFPSTSDIAYQVMKRGGSYVGACYSPIMAEYLRKATSDRVIRGVVDPNEKFLYDARFSKEAAEAGVGHHGGFSDMHVLFSRKRSETYSYQSQHHFSRNIISFCHSLHHFLSLSRNPCLVFVFFVCISGRD
jgi:hypothetical protein